MGLRPTAQLAHYVQTFEEYGIAPFTGGSHMKKLLFFLTVVLFFNIVSTAQGENWKLYYQGAKFKSYYDKDSIHYPQKMKGLLGIKSDKNCIGVWTKDSYKDTYSLLLIYFYCNERKRIVKEQYFYSSDGKNEEKMPLTFEPYVIKPGDENEKLYDILCK
jgi:hypothetical protein